MQTEGTHCKKACNLKEYKLEKASAADYFTRTNDTIAVVLKFDSPSSRRQSRLMLPYKTVHTEYLVTTWISLVGAVGGTLGMFVGFSIIGTSEWFMAHLWICWKKAFGKGSGVPQA